MYSLSKDYLVIVVTHNLVITKLYESNIININNGCIKSSLELEDCGNKEFICDKTSSISRSIVKKMSLEILFRNKIWLIFTLLFTIISILCFSVSLSVFNYNENEVMLNQMIKYNDYVVARLNNWPPDDKILTSDILFLEKYNQDMVYSYSIENISLVDIYKVSDLFMSNTFTSYTDGTKVFVYNEDSINIFSLNVINGEEPKSDDECVITKFIADEFIKYNYKYNDVLKNINDYNDLIGLDLFGYKIVGILDFKYSNYYLDIISEFERVNSDYTDFIGSRMYDVIYNSCAYSFFTYKDLFYTNKVIFNIFQESPNYFSSNYYINDASIDYREFAPSNVIYASDCDDSSSGIILNIDLFSEFYFGNTFVESINYRFEVYRSDPCWKSYSDSELYDIVCNEISNEINSILNENIEFNLDIIGDNDSRYEYSITQNLIGITYESDALLYIEHTDEIDNYINIIESITNIDAIFSEALDNDDCLGYIAILLDFYINGTIEDSYRLHLSNDKISDLIDYNYVFTPIKIIFLVVCVIFLALSIFVLYKYIYDSIKYKELEINVLKVIGVANRYIYKIFGIPNLIISIIVIILSSLLVYTLIYGINFIVSNIYEVYVESFYLYIYNYLVIIVFSIIIPFIAVRISIRRQEKKNPKDILNK